MRSASERGFTLIELLTVIAIITILTGMVAVGLPRMLEKAKLADVQNDLNLIRGALATYMTQHGSYPPRYGYLSHGKDDNGVPATLSADDNIKYFLQPYTIRIGLFREFGAYDRFKNGTNDADGDNDLSLLEFCPIGLKDLANPGQFTFPTSIYDPLAALPADVQSDHDAQLDTQGPYIYIPVNASQARRVAKYYGWQYQHGGNNPGYAKAEIWDPSEAMADDGSGSPPRNPLNMSFPPTRYDAFVLIGVGPKENVFGVVPPTFGSSSDVDYHIWALRTYFLATRDWNDDGEPDFDFNVRRLAGSSYQATFAPPALALLPDDSSDYGPIIYEPES
jgi:prepilin-type N-terminal cleavage/methylation domain-containing protein